VLAALLAALLCAAAAAASGEASASGRAPRRAPARHRTPSRPSPVARRAALNQQRALMAYAAMQRAYYNAAGGLYTGSPYADAWAYSQAMAATISVAALPGMHRSYRADLVARLQGLHAYADTTHPAPAGYASAPVPPIGPGGDRFDDDNNWIGIELIRLYHLDRNPSLLATANNIFGLVTAQWSKDASYACPGGATWRTGVPDSERNTVTNATGAELGAQLFMTGGSADDLAWAQRMYAWVRTCLLNPDGLYGDHLNVSDGYDTTEWTYNQGLMIGAGVMLYQATHDRSYLRDAIATAKLAMHHYDGATLAIQGDGFNAIYIRNLLLLGAASGDPAYAQFARWYAGDAWLNVRDAGSGLFRYGPGGDTNLIEQAAMVQVYALLAEPMSAYF
jgi:hypothetical protein